MSQSGMLLLTCLHICDCSRVVKRATEKAAPTGGPEGSPHGSRMTGVSPQASAALYSIPNLPHMEIHINSSNSKVVLMHCLNTRYQKDWRALSFFMFLIKIEKIDILILDNEANAPHYVWLRGKKKCFSL